MAFCPNINLESWKNLVAARGENIAYYLWDKYAGSVPEEEYTDEENVSLLYQLDPGTIEKNNKQLDDFLLNFLKPFGVRSKEFDDLKERLGIDALGATDVLNKLIWYNKDREIDTLPEEASHMIVMLMGESNPDVKYLLDRITNWSEYKSIYDTYMPLYNNEKQVKIEAVGKLVAKAIVKNFKESGLDKSLLERAMKLINAFFNKIVGIFKDKKEGIIFNSKNIADKIAINVLSGNTDYVASLVTPNVPVNYQKSISDNPLARNIINMFTGGPNNFKLVGSLAIAGQGEKIYRPENEPIHDLDFKVSLENSKTNFRSLLRLLGAIRTHNGWSNSNYTTEAYYIPAKGYEVRALRRRFRDGYAAIKDVELIDKSTGNVVPIDAKNLAVVDFFVYKKSDSEVDKGIFKSWQDVYGGKMGFSPIGTNERMFQRAKDQTDYILSTPSDVSVSKPEFFYYQTEETPASKTSPEIIAKVKQVLEKMGVSIKELQEYAKEAKLNIPGGVNGLADIASKIIAIAEGKEDVALTEEMVHIATAILEKKNPGLVTEMISKIDRFTIYKRTLKEYENNPKYQLANGKPDIRKIKKEAVDKLITELIVNEGSNSTDFPELMEEENVSLIQKWWRKILDWFSLMYKEANIDVFQEAAGEIMGEDFSAEGVDLSSDGVYYQLSDAQKAIQKKIIETNKIIRKKEDVTSPIDPLLQDTEEASNYYEALQPDGTWKRVAKRVTDRVKAWYKSKFPGKVFSPQEKRFNEVKRKAGVKFHSFFEDIHGRFFNSETGERKPKTSARQIKLDNNVDREVYNELEKYFVELIDSFTKDGKSPLVFSEVMLYDPKEKEAGTIDLLIVDENGKANIIDWKFMSVGASVDNLPWFKQGAYNVQLSRYKDMLREVYGVKEMGINRAIPIILKTEIENKKKENPSLIISGIAIGSVDTSKIKDFTLLPFSEKSESTEIDELDEVLKKLNTVYEQIQKKEVSSTEESEFKKERLQILNKAIRKLQTSQDLSYLFAVIQTMSKEGDILSRDYTMKYKGKPANSKGPDFEQKALSEFAASLREYAAFAKVFGNITDYIGDFIYNEKMEKDAKTKEEKDELLVLKKGLGEIKKQQDNIRRSSIEVGKIAGEFADKFVGQRNLVKGLIDAEAIVKGLSSLFRGVGDLGMASLEVLVKMVSNAKDRGVRDASGNVDKLMEIRKKLVARGGDVRKLVQRIYQKDDKNNPVNKIIHRYKKDFFEEVDLNAQEGARSKKWLLANIDVEAYNAEVKPLLEKKIERIKDLYSDDETIDDKILEERRKFDISRKDFVGWNNFIIKRHPLPKWESEEYKEIKKDKDLFELYEFIVQMNSKAKDVGYISNAAASTFLPFVRKGMAESLAWDFDLSAITNFGKSLSLRADTVGYGNLNELTNELENSIPKYYTYDFTRGEDGANDFSEVSEDIFKNMILYIGHVEKYKYLSEIEEQLLLVKKIEQFKGHLRTNNIGEAVMDDRGMIDVLGEGEKDSEGNTKIFNDFLKALLYEQKYPLSDSDTPLNIGVKEFMKKAINKVAGREVFKPEENPSATSLVKTMDAANKAFQLKTLGFEFISGAVNAFGSNIQIAAQSGNYFKSREVLANEMKLIGNKWRSKDEYDMYTQLVNLILPLREDPNYEKMKAAGLNPFTKRSFSDDIMVFMRYPEQHLEKAVFLTLLENTMVVDGRFVNINEYVKRKYKGRSESATRYKEASAKIANEVEELKKTKSISAIKKLEDGKLVIPGFDITNIEELQKLSSLTKRISRNALGGMSEADMNRIGLNIWTKSMMVFKNWIPKLLDTRFGEFRKVSDDFSVEIGDDGLTTGEKYDIGRIRLFGNFLHFNILRTVSEIVNVLSVNEKGLLKINELYEKYADDYKKKTGKDLEMSRDEFVDLIRTNLRNQTKELMMLAVLFSSSLAIGIFKPDDDDDKADKNFYRFSQRVLDKFIGELSFFYNPVEFEKLLSGSAFPAVGITTDFARFVKHFFMQITGEEFLEFDSELTPEQVRKKAQPVKNLGKMFPGTKSLFTYGAILDAEFAKEYDITIQKETGFR
jgi:hypothetical protein